MSINILPNIYEIEISNNKKIVRDNEFSNTLFDMLNNTTVNEPIRIRVSPDDYTRREITYEVNPSTDRFVLAR